MRDSRTNRSACDACRAISPHERWEDGENGWLTSNLIDLCPNCTNGVPDKVLRIVSILADKITEQERRLDDFIDRQNNE